jgi:hypothetical protein
MRRRNRSNVSMQCVLMVFLLVLVIILTGLTGTIVNNCISTPHAVDTASAEIQPGAKPADKPKTKRVRGLKAKKGPAIPKILHQIWISRDGKSSNPLPKFCVKESNKMRQVHEAAGWEYHLWGDELWKMYESDAIVTAYFRANFDKQSLAFITDRFRLLLLRDYGGVFCDVDARLVKSFDSLLKKLPPTTTFFAGMRDLEGVMPNAIVEVAVMGSAKHSRVMDGVSAMYSPPDRNGGVNIPHGGRVGRWIVSFLDEHSVLLNYHYFYADGDKLTNESIVLQNGLELGTWRHNIKNAFAPALTPPEKDTLLKMYTILQDLIEEELKTTPWLGGVALLGYGRNGTLCPWEDGLDLMIEEQYKQEALKKVVPRMKAHGYSGEGFWGGIKFWKTSDPPIVGYRWAFPNLDLRVYQKKGPVLVLHGNGGKDHKVSTEHIKPFKEVGFEGIKVKVPNHVHEVLTAQFDDYQGMCVSRTWDRHIEKGHESSRVDCSKLVGDYPVSSTWKQLGPAKPRE